MNIRERVRQRFPSITESWVDKIAELIGAIVREYLENYKNDIADEVMKRMIEELDRREAQDKQNEMRRRAGLDG